MDKDTYYIQLSVSSRVNSQDFTILLNTAYPQGHVAGSFEVLASFMGCSTVKFQRSIRDDQSYIDERIASGETSSQAAIGQLCSEFEEALTHSQGCSQKTLNLIITKLKNHAACRVIWPKVK
jgi:hypothetical protein